MLFDINENFNITLPDYYVDPEGDEIGYSVSIKPESISCINSIFFLFLIVKYRYSNYIYSRLIKAR